MAAQETTRRGSLSDDESGDEATSDQDHRMAKYRHWEDKCVAASELIRDSRDLVA